MGLRKVCSIGNIFQLLYYGRNEEIESHTEVLDGVRTYLSFDEQCLQTEPSMPETVVQIIHWGPDTCHSPNSKYSSTVSESSNIKYSSVCTVYYVAVQCEWLTWTPACPSVYKKGIDTPLQFNICLTCWPVTVDSWSPATYVHHRLIVWYIFDV